MTETELKELIETQIEPANCPGLLRLAFHDAGTFRHHDGTGGVSGSVTTAAELEREENDGLAKSVLIVADIKRTHPQCSLPDIIAVAGAVAVRLCGGPDIQVGLGRGEDLRPSPTGRLPDKEDDADSLLQRFAAMGLDGEELVALSGAHTIGDAEDKPFTDNRLTFDNSYFQRLVGDTRVSHLRFFTSDEALLTVDELKRCCERFAVSQSDFFDAFSRAYQKMTRLGG